MNFVDYEYCTNRYQRVGQGSEVQDCSQAVGFAVEEQL